MTAPNNPRHMTFNDWRKLCNPDNDISLVSDDAIHEYAALAHGQDWRYCPVGLLLPEVREEFRGMTARLGKIQSERGAEAHRDAIYATTPPLFRAGASFGDLMEQLSEARASSVGYGKEQPIQRKLYLKLQSIITMACDYNPSVASLI